MKKESNSQNNSRFSKIFKNVIKYFVFIFAFVLVGLVSSTDKVEGAYFKSVTFSYTDALERSSNCGADNSYSCENGTKMSFELSQGVTRNYQIAFVFTGRHDVPQSDGTYKNKVLGVTIWKAPISTSSGSITIELELETHSVTGVYAVSSDANLYNVAGDACNLGANDGTLSDISNHVGDLLTDSTFASNVKYKYGCQLDVGGIKNIIYDIPDVYFYNNNIGEATKISNNDIIYMPGKTSTIDFYASSEDLFYDNSLSSYYPVLTGRCIYYTSGSCENNVKLQYDSADEFVDKTIIGEEERGGASYREGLINEINYKTYSSSFALTENSIYILKYEVYFREHHKNNVLTFYLLFDSIQGQERFAEDAIYTNKYTSWTEDGILYYIDSINLEKSVESYLNPETLKYCSDNIEGACGTMARAINARLDVILPPDVSSLIQEYYKAPGKILPTSMKFAHSGTDYYSIDLLHNTEYSYVLPVSVNHTMQVFTWETLHAVITIHSYPSSYISSSEVVLLDDMFKENSVSDEVDVYFNCDSFYMAGAVVSDVKERTLNLDAGSYYLSSNGETSVSFYVNPEIKYKEKNILHESPSYSIDNKVMQSTIKTSYGKNANLCSIDSTNIFKVNCELDTTSDFTEIKLYFDYTDLFGNTSFSDAYAEDNLNVTLKIFNKTLQEMANNIEPLTLWLNNNNVDTNTELKTPSDYGINTIPSLTYVISNSYDNAQLSLFYSEGYLYSSDRETANFSSDGYDFIIKNNHVCNYAKSTEECDDVATINVKLLKISGNDITYSGDKTSVSVKNGGEYVIDGTFSLNENMFVGWDISFLQEKIQLAVTETINNLYIDKYKGSYNGQEKDSLATINFDEYSENLVDGIYYITVQVSNIALDSDQEVMECHFKLYLYNTSLSLKPLKVTETGEYEEIYSVMTDDGKSIYYLNGKASKDSEGYIHVIFEVTNQNVASCIEGDFQYVGDKYKEAIHETEIPCRFDLKTDALASAKKVDVTFEIGDLQIGDIYNDASLTYSFYIDNEAPSFDIHRSSKYSSYIEGQTINYSIEIGETENSGMLFYKDDIANASTSLCDYKSSIQIGRNNENHSANTCELVSDDNGIQTYSVEFLVDSNWVKGIDYKYIALNNIIIVDYAHNELSGYEADSVEVVIIEKKEITKPEDFLSNTYLNLITSKTFINNDFDIKVKVNIKKSQFLLISSYLASSTDDRKYGIEDYEVYDEEYIIFKVHLDNLDSILIYDILHIEFEYNVVMNNDQTRCALMDYEIDINGTYYVVYEADTELVASEYTGDDSNIVLLRNFIPSNYDINVNYEHEVGIKNVELVDANNTEIAYCQYSFGGDKLSLTDCKENEDLSTYGDLYVVITDNVNNVSEKYLLIENLVVDTHDPEIDNKELTIGNNKISSSQYFVLGDSLLYSSTGDIYYTFTFTDNVEVSSISYEIIDTIESEEYSILDLFTITRDVTTDKNVLKLKFEIKDSYSGEVDNIKIKLNLVVRDTAGNILEKTEENNYFNFIKLEDLSDLTLKYTILNSCTRVDGININYCDLSSGELKIKIENDYLNYIKLNSEDFYIEGYEEISIESDTVTVKFNKNSIDNLDDIKIVLKVNDSITSTTIHGSILTDLNLNETEKSITTYGYDSIDDSQKVAATTINCQYNDKDNCMSSFKSTLYPYANDELYEYEITIDEEYNFDVVGEYTIKSRVCYSFNTKNCLDQQSITVNVLERAIVVTLDESKLSGSYDQDINAIITIVSYTGELSGEDELEDMITFSLATLKKGKNRVVLNCNSNYADNYTIILAKNYDYILNSVTISLTDTILNGLTWYIDKDFKTAASENSLVREYEPNNVNYGTIYAKSTLNSGYEYILEAVVKYDGENAGEKIGMIIEQYLSSNELYDFDRIRDYTINKGFGKITPKGIDIDLSSSIWKYYDKSSTITLDTNTYYTYSTYTLKATDSVQYYYTENKISTSGNNSTVGIYYLLGEKKNVAFELIDQPNYTIRSVKAAIMPDTEVPTFTINGSTPQSAYYSTSPITFTVVANDNNTNVAPTIIVKQPQSSDPLSNQWTLSSGEATYVITVTDAAGNYVTQEITASIDTTDPDIAKVDGEYNITLNATSYANTNSFKVTIPLSETVSSFAMDEFNLSLEKNDLEIEIGENYVCVLTSSKTSIECSGRITNKNITSNEAYEGVIVDFTSLYLVDNAGNEKTICYPNIELANVSVNFSYASVSVDSVEFKKGDSVTKNVNKVYGAFDTFTIKFAFSKQVDATISGLQLKVGTYTTNEITCSVSNTIYTCSLSDISISLNKNYVYDMSLVGTIIYTDNNHNIVIDVSKDLYDEKLEDLKYDPRSITPTLSFEKIDTTNKEITFNVSYDRDEYVNESASFDTSKVKVIAKDLTLIANTPIVLEKNKLTIKYSNDVLADISFQLEADAITDALGNTSNASNKIELDLSSITVIVSSPNGTKSVSTNKVTLLFGRNAIFTSQSQVAVAVLTYKYGSGDARDVETAVGTNGVSSIVFDIDIIDGDNGALTIVSVKSKNNGKIKDENGTEYDSLNINSSTRLIADTKGPGVKLDENNNQLVTIHIGKEAHTDNKYYLNNVALAQVSISVVFDETLYAPDSNLIITINGVEKLSDRYDVNGNTITYTLQVNEFNQGDIIISELRYYLVDNLGNNSTDSIAIDEYNLVYDNTAPSIKSIDVNDATVNSSTEVIYKIHTSEISCDDITLSDERYECSDTDDEVILTYITKYEGKGGLQKFTVPAKLITDLAGNTSSSKSASLVTVSDDKPTVSILSISAVNGNNVYYDGETAVLITLDIGGSEQTCTLDLINNNCGTYITVDSDKKLVINANITTENEYGNSNDSVTTSYVIVDYSDTEFILKAEDNENTTVIDSENKVVVSSNVENTYVYQFTSTRDLKLVVSEGTLVRVEDDENKTYKYSFTQNINLDKVILQDYLGNEATLFEIEHDNIAPIINVSSYFANVAQASEGIEIVATIVGAASVKGGTLTTTGGTLGNITDTLTNLEFPFIATQEGKYVVTIPSEYYEDIIGNKSSATKIEIVISNNPEITPLITVDGNLIEAESNNGIYYLNDLSELKFKVSLPGNDSATCSGTDDIDSSCVYTISNNTSKEVTIAADTFTIGDISNVEATFKFEEYKSVSVTSSVSTDKEKWLVLNDTLTFTYEIDNLLLNNDVPTLIISINDIELPALYGKLESTNKLVYNYKVNGEYDGVVKVVKFGEEIILKDLAHNVINEVNIADTTAYTIDTTPVEEPILNVSGSNCVASIQNGETYYYCSNARDIVVNVTNIAENSTVSLTLTINGESVDMINYSYTLSDVEGKVVIVLQGSVSDQAGNSTSVNLTNSSYVVKEYTISVNLHEDSPTIISEENGYPTFVVTNSIGIYDNILSELNKSAYYRMFCGESICSSITGLTLSHSTSVGINSDINVIVSGKITQTFSDLEAELVIVNESEGYINIKGQKIKVEYDNNSVVIDTKKREVTSYTITTKDSSNNSLRFNNKDYIVNDSTVEIKLTFDGELANPNVISILIGKENSYLYGIEYTYNEETGTYILDVDDINDLYNNKYRYDSNVELIVKIDNILGNNGVNNSYTLATEVEDVYYKLHIDKEAPTVEFGDLVDNKDHKLLIEGNINVSDSNSGVKSIEYYIDGVMVDTNEGYISFASDDYPSGEYTIGVIAKDNVDKDTPMLTKTIYIDKTPASITLEGINYTDNSLNAVFDINDDSSIDGSEVGYTILGDNTSYTGKATIVDNQIIVTSDLSNYIYDTNLKLILDSVSDVMGNSTETIPTNLLSLNAINDNTVYLTSKNNCSELENCNYEYSINITNNENYGISLDEIITPFNGNVNGTSIIISSSENVKGLTLTVTVSLNNITVTYDIKLDNVIVNVNKLTEDEITIVLNNGTTITDITHNNEYIKSLTSDTVCEVNKECSVVVNVSEKSGWNYQVTKVLKVTDLGEYSPNIIGVSGNTILINHNVYQIIDQNVNDEYKVTFDFASLSNLSVVETVYEYSLSLGDYKEYTFTYYDNNLDKVAITNTYYVCVVKDVTVNVSDGYKKVHEINVSDIVDTSRKYSATYTLAITYMDTEIEFILKSNVDGKGNVSTFLTHNNLVNVSYESTRKVITIELKNSVDNSNDIVVVEATYYINIDSGATNIDTNEYKFKFDNNIGSDEYEVSVSDMDVWTQSKNVAIKFDCDSRSNNSTCKYYLVEDEDIKELEDNTFVKTVIEIGTYTFEFQDDAGNIITIEQVVNNIDTVAPEFVSSSILGCEEIEGKVYCYSPTVEVLATDSDSYVNYYHFGYTLENGSKQIIDPIQLSIITFNFELLPRPGDIYSIFVVIEDAAGNEVEQTLYENINYNDSKPVVDDIAVNDRINKVIIPNYTSDMSVTSIELCMISDTIDTCYTLDTLSSGSEIDLKSYVEEDIENVYIYFRVTNILGIATSTNEELVTIDVTRPLATTISSLVTNNGKYYVGTEGLPEELMTVTALDDDNPSIRVSVGDSCRVYNMTSKIVLVNNVSENPIVNITCNETDIEIVVLDEAGNESELLSFVLVIDTQGPVLEKGNNVTIDNNGIERTYTLPFVNNSTNPLQNNVYSIDASGNDYVIKSTNKYKYSLDLKMFDDLESGIKNACLVKGVDISKCRTSSLKISYPNGISSGFATLSEGVWSVYTRDNVGNESIYTYTIEYLKAVNFDIDGELNTITKNPILLNITTGDNIEGATISWQVKYVDTDIYEDLSACADLTACTAEANGIYKVTITRYGIPSVVTQNVDVIHPNELFDEDNNTLTVSGTNYIAISDNSGYFSDNSTITIDYPKVSSNYTLNEFTAIIYCRQVVGQIKTNCFKTQDQIKVTYKRNQFNSDLVFELKSSMLKDLLNGTAITIEVILQGLNETEQEATKATFEFIYLNKDNYKDANINLWTDSDSEKVKISQINTTYHTVYLEVVNVAYSYSINHQYYLIINGDATKKQEFTMNSLMSLEEGIYSSFQIYVIDDLKISTTLDCLINVNTDGESLDVNRLIVDKTPDEILLNEKIDENSTNKAYVSYEAYIQNGNKFVLITEIDNLHGHQFTINGATAETPYTVTSLDESGNIAFTIKVIDAANNEFSKDIIISEFVDEPTVTFSVTKKQNSAGQDAILTLSYDVKNQYHFHFEGYYVCTSNSDETCTSDELITDMNVSGYVGKYIKVIANDTYNSVNYDLSEFIDLTNVAIKAPVITMDSSELVSNIEKGESISVDIGVTYDSVNTNKRKLRYILRDIDSNVVGADVITSATFMNIYTLSTKKNDIVDCGVIEDDSLTLTLKEGGYILYVLGEDDGVYSSLISKTIYIDSTAPVAKYLDEDIIYGETAVYSTNLSSVKLLDSSSRNSKIIYKLDNASIYTVYEKSFNITNGSHTLEVCDVVVVDSKDTPLNCRSYFITVDSANPTVSLIPKDNDVDLDSSTVYGYKINSMKDNQGNPVYVLDSRLSVEDASLMTITFTVNLTNSNYVFKYNVLNNRFEDRYGNELVLNVSNNLIKWIGKTSELDKLVSVEGRPETIIIDDTTFKVNYDGQGNIKNVTPIMDITGNYYEISIKALFALTLQYNKNSTLHDIVKLSVEASDYYTKSSNMSYNLDLKNPDIDVRSVITSYTNYLSNNNIYLVSDSAADYATDKTNTMLKSCSLQTDDYSTCKAGLYLQVVKDDVDTASRRLLQILEHIILIDGVSNYDKSSLRIYYEGSLSGAYITGFNDYLKKLDHLTHMTLNNKSKLVTPHIIYIMYTDNAGNSSTYYIQIHVEDTLAPDINNASSEKRTLTINSNDSYPYFTYPITVSDNYYSDENIECTFTLAYNGNEIKDSYDCTSNNILYIDDIVVGEYVVDTDVRLYLRYKGEYVLTYKYEDGSGNTSSKKYIITVNDNTGVEYLIEDNPDDSIDITINSNVIDLGEYAYDDVNRIVFRNFASITITEKHEFTSSYSINNLRFVSITLDGSKLDISDVSLNGYTYNLIGAYRVTYKVVNTSGKETNIVYTFKVNDVTPPTIELVDNEGVSYNEDVFEVKVPENYSSTLEQLRDSKLNTIKAIYRDNYTSSDALNFSKVSCSVQSNIDNINRYIISYTCTYKVQDGSKNTTTRSITIHIKDDIKPDIEGDIFINDDSVNYTYTSEETLSLELPACMDNYNNSCTRYYSVVNGSEDVEYRGKVNIRLSEGKNIIKYYTVDSVGNKSLTKYYAYILDTTAPIVDYVLSNGSSVEDYNTCSGMDNASICKVDNDSNMYVLGNDKYSLLQLMFYDENLQNNSISIAKLVSNVYKDLDDYNIVETGLYKIVDIVETGLYRIVVQDKAYNLTQREFYVYKETYGESGELNINVKDNEENITIAYRNLYLVEYDKNKQSIVHHDEAFAAIKKTDGVYVIGVNSNNEYVKLVKYNGNDVYNTATTIKANVSGISDALINIEGKNYLIMILVENDNANESGNKVDQTTQNGEKKGNNASYSWIFYVLGVIGVLGGGFLIMKLRNKIKAA